MVRLQLLAISATTVKSFWSPLPMTAWYIFSVMVRLAILMTWNSAIFRQAWSVRTIKVKRQLWARFWKMSLAMVTAPARRTAIWLMVVLFSAKRLISKPLCLVRWVKVDAVRMRWILVQWRTVIVVVGIRLYLCLKQKKALVISWVIPLVRHKLVVCLSSAILPRLIWNRMCVIRVSWPAAIVLRMWTVPTMKRLCISMIWRVKKLVRKIPVKMFPVPASSWLKFLCRMAKAASLLLLW